MAPRTKYALSFPHGFRSRHRERLWPQWRDWLLAQAAEA